MKDNTDTPNGQSSKPKVAKGDTPTAAAPSDEDKKKILRGALGLAKVTWLEALLLIQEIYEEEQERVTDLQPSDSDTKSRKVEAQS